MLCASILYRDVCQLFLNKTGENALKTNEYLSKSQEIKWFS